jgi:glycosyltransferase involved in cell wall biosynthesis
MVINQWVPAAHRGDAIGDSARRMRDLLRRLGHTSELYALTIDDDLAGDVRPFSDRAARGGDITIFHFAVPSPMTAQFAKLDAGRILLYHNITPPHFFAPYDAALFRLAELGRRELATLAGHTDLALGDSGYNRRELDRLGFARTAVLPIAVDLDRLRKTPPCPALDDVLRDDGLTNILFVGRIAPNKRIEDHIRLAEHYKRYVDTMYRFIFVGRYDGVPRYYSMVRALIAQYRMLPERFLFVGGVPDRELAAYYRAASAYVSLSEHEGFCVPLLEAMAMNVPVLAYAAGAVPETMGGAGVLFSPKDLECAAELLGMLVYDDEVRAPVIEGQHRRVRDFQDDAIERNLVKMLGELLT